MLWEKTNFVSVFDIFGYMLMRDSRTTGQMEYESLSLKVFRLKSSRIARDALILIDLNKIDLFWSIFLWSFDCLRHFSCFSHPPSFRLSVYLVPFAFFLIAFSIFGLVLFCCSATKKQNRNKSNKKVMSIHFVHNCCCCVNEEMCSCHSLITCPCLI